MPLLYRNRASLMNTNPELVQALDDITSHIENTQQQLNVAPNGQASPPPPPAALTVTAAQGIYEAAIQDNVSSVNRGVNYFLEYSTTPSFNKPTTIDLGASRNFRGHFGNQKLYWRASSQYPTSPRSSLVYHGTETQPIMVAGGGAITGPALLPSNGSGTTSGASGSDGGFGNFQYRGTTRPTNS